VDGTQPLPPAPPELPDDAASGEPEDARRLVEARLRRVSLESRRLEGLHALDVEVDGGNWANLDARGASLRRVALRDVRLTGAAFAEARLEDVSFVRCRLDLASFRFARLERVSFVDCRLEESDFYEATLESVAFADCGLERAAIDGATFSRCELRRCALDGLRGAERLRGVRMPWVDVVAATELLATAIGIEIVE
jgi:uncharacterized protein YjbI with pentapeptide repeats